MHRHTEHIWKPAPSPTPLHICSLPSPTTKSTFECWPQRESEHGPKSPSSAGPAPPPHLGPVPNQTRLPPLSPLKFLQAWGKGACWGARGQLRRDSGLSCAKRGLTIGVGERRPISEVEKGVCGDRTRVPLPTVPAARSCRGPEPPGQRCLPIQSSMPFRAQAALTAKLSPGREDTSP